ncbi:IPT/TIG domain-containing protein [Hymenobacter negativus]|uniref:IPT/TIG domain-containing protein n=1 Tax=Hymenobacter negativus TaxID=2795026 RepID=UPI001AAFD7E9|nr:IPT/TIG domain-containing protein [Hymenobacter negativus]
MLSRVLPGQAQTVPASPTWQWVQPLRPPTLGGSFRAEAVARDRHGDYYLTGSFEGTVLVGDVWLRGRAQEQAFVVRLGPDGRCRWASALPTSTNRLSAGQSIAVDGTGHIWVSGSTDPDKTGLDVDWGPAPPGARDSLYHFVARLDSAGRWQWQHPVRLLPALRSRVAADAQGHGYLNGGPLATGPGKAAPPLASRLSAAGTWEWALATGPGRPLRSPALAVSPAGALYLGGPIPRPAPLPPRPKPQGPVAATPLHKGLVLALYPNGEPHWQAQVPEVTLMQSLSVGPAGEILVAANLEQPTVTRFYNGRRLLESRLQSRQLLVTSLSSTGQRRWQAWAAATGTHYAGPGLYAESTLAAREVSVGPDGQVWLSCALLGSATLSGVQPMSLSGGNLDHRRPSLLLVRLDAQGHWRGASGGRSSELKMGSGQLVANANSAIVVNGPADPYSFAGQSEATIPLFEATAGQSDQLRPLLSVDCGTGESTVSTLAPLPHAGGWLVAGSFAGQLPTPDGRLDASSGHDVLTGQLADNGTVRWLRAGGLPWQSDVPAIGTAVSDSSGRLLVTGRCRFSPEDAPAASANSLQARLHSALPRNHREVMPFVGQVGRDGQWRWAHYLPNDYSDAIPDVAAAPDGRSWLAYSRPVRDTASWSPPGFEVLFQQRDPEGRLTAEKVLGRGNLRNIRLAPGPGAAWYLAGEVADSLVLTTAHGQVRFRPLPPPTPPQEQQHQQVLLKMAASGRVAWARPLGTSLTVQALAAAPAGELWLTAQLTTDSVTVPTQPPSKFKRLLQDRTCGLLGRLDSTGAWRWARQGLDPAPAIAPAPGNQLFVATALVGEPSPLPPPDTTQPTPPGRLAISQLSARGQVLAEWDPEEALHYQEVSALRVAPNGDLLLAGAFSANSHGGYVARLQPPARPAPVVQQLLPPRLAPGTTLELQGTGLDQVQQVLLNEVAADFETVSAQLLRVRVPVGIPPGKVRVAVRAGTTSVTVPLTLRVR